MLCTATYEFVRFFLENNNKTQTISLVRKCFKLLWFLTIRVKRGRFLGFLFYYLPAAEVGGSGHVGRNRVQSYRFLSLENEFKGLGFQPKNRVHWTRFPGLKTESNGLVF